MKDEMSSSFLSQFCLSTTIKLSKLNKLICPKLDPLIHAGVAMPQLSSSGVLFLPMFR